MAANQAFSPNINVADWGQILTDMFQNLVEAVIAAKGEQLSINDNGFGMLGVHILLV